MGDLVKPCLHLKLASDHAATMTGFWGDLVATLGDLVKPCLHPKLASDHAATMKGFGGDLGVTLGFPREGRASSSYAKGAGGGEVCCPSDVLELLD